MAPLPLCRLLDKLFFLHFAVEVKREKNGGKKKKNGGKKEKKWRKKRKKMAKKKKKNGGKNAFSIKLCNRLRCRECRQRNVFFRENKSERAAATHTASSSLTFWQ
jgi:hypothetical protein